MDDQNNEQRENRSLFSILLKAQVAFQTYDLRMPILSSHFLHNSSLPNLLRLITEVKSSLPRVREGAFSVGVMIDRVMLCLVDITGVVWVEVTIVCLELSHLSSKVFRGC